MHDCSHYINFAPSVSNSETVLYKKCSIFCCQKGDSTCSGLDYYFDMQSGDCVCTYRSYSSNSPFSVFQIVNVSNMNQNGIEQCGYRNASNDSGGWKIYQSMNEFRRSYIQKLDCE